MKINLDKNKFIDIDKAFVLLKEMNDNQNAISMIKSSLESCFKDLTFDINIVKSKGINSDYEDSFFIMSVFPEKSTATKIIYALANTEKNKENIVRKIWEKNKKWTIEIDDKILQSTYFDFTDRELTALLLHEIGHIIYSNSITNRISTILQYEIAKASMSNKILMKDKIFSKIMSLPILNACVADSKSKAIKYEIKADSFSKKMGYSKELHSVLSKIINSKYHNLDNNIDENMKNVTNFSIDTINQLRTRQNKIMKHSLESVIETCESPYIRSVVQDYYDTLFEVCDGSSLTDERKIEYMEERAEKIINDGYITEFFFNKTEKLKRIDPAELDYIDIKTNEIKSEDDKMMLISYLHSKMDMVDYYIQILSNPNLNKKYIIPHTIDNLLAIKKRLEKSRENIINFKIPERNKGLYIAWPENYDG